MSPSTRHGNRRRSSSTPCRIVVREDIRRWASAKRRTLAMAVSRASRSGRPSPSAASRSSPRVGGSHRRRFPRRSASRRPARPRHRAARTSARIRTRRPHGGIRYGAAAEQRVTGPECDRSLGPEIQALQPQVGSTGNDAGHGRYLLDREREDARRTGALETGEQPPHLVRADHGVDRDHPCVGERDHRGRLQPGQQRFKLAESLRRRTFPSSSSTCGRGLR